jgi:hypothetical protein
MLDEICKPSITSISQSYLVTLLNKDSALSPMPHFMLNLFTCSSTSCAFSIAFKPILCHCHDKALAASLALYSLLLLDAKH